MWAIGREPCLPCSAIERSTRLRRCRRAWRPFTCRSGPTTACTVSAPTLGPYDYVYRLDPNTGTVDRVYSRFGRPQGIAFDSQGALYVVEALAGSNGLYRVRSDGTTELVVAGQSLVGVAFDPNGGLVVTSNDTAYRLNVPIRPLM